MLALAYCARLPSFAIAPPSPKFEAPGNTFNSPSPAPRGLHPTGRSLQAETICPLRLARTVWVWFHKNCLATISCYYQYVQRELWREGPVGTSLHSKAAL